tara:strand:- start:2447 stop:3022 length:576 start_codon:yes stop_codon:yes gene_type:complete
MLNNLLDGKNFKKGKPLLIGVISVLVTALGSLMYTAASFALDKVNDQQNKISDLTQRVVAVETVKPLTRKELGEELKVFNQSQRQLYRDLANQTQNSTSMTVQAYSDAHRAVVNVLAKQQEDLAKRTEIALTSMNTETKKALDQVKRLEELSAKDREAIKVLQYNLNRSLEEAAKDRALLLELLQELKKDK